MNTGTLLWKKSKKIIPGGNMLLSKRAEMFLPERWPSYFSKAKGCFVWDLDGVMYKDMSLMGIGTNTLGYGHPDVDASVIEVIQKGNMSTLNCPEEVELAEKLVEIHDWAQMVRFARTGAEANAIAIRIARASTGKDKVAICGYHGWQDWYLSVNLTNNKGLDGHLLPGLEPNGVPKAMKDIVIPFRYNEIQELEHIIDENKDIGVVMMEVQRNEEPKDGFLHKVRNLCKQKGIVLIFDECTSGFRETFGGLHKKFNVNPDLAMFGKALGNGYAINAVIGRREIMEAAQSTFISSTFWTERIGSAAAISTLKTMEKMQSWNIISDTGEYISRRWLELANKYQLSIRTFGLKPLMKFAFNSGPNLAYKTYITQEMLKKGFLAGNQINVCTEHTSELLEEYFNALDPIFGIISQCENGRDIHTLLEVPVCHSEFKRLN